MLALRVHAGPLSTLGEAGLKRFCWMVSSDHPPAELTLVYGNILVWRDLCQDVYTNPIGAGIRIMIKRNLTNNIWFSKIRLKAQVAGEGPLGTRLSPSSGLV